MENNTSSSTGIEITASSGEPLYHFSYDYLHWNAINSRKSWQTYKMYNSSELQIYNAVYISGLSLSSHFLNCFHLNYKL